MTGATARKGSNKAVVLLFRLVTLALAITSAVIMGTASKCTINGLDGATPTTTTVTFNDYQPFVYLVWSSVTVSILEMAAICLHVCKGGDGENKILGAIDVAVQMLLYSATGAVFAAAVAYGPQISACASAAGYFSQQLVDRSKIISLVASLCAPCPSY